MDNLEVNKKFINAAKWSSITEIVAKIIIPITNMILARILAPEAFGVLATVSMVISFAEIFADAGFQKYLIQHEFKTNEIKYKVSTVAFWTNLGISIFLWTIIALFSEPIATLIGNPGLGNVITIACIQLPLISCSSIQMALYKRNFEFKTLFLVRIVSVFIPFVVTIPLALFGFTYWALIIGTIIIQLSNAIILTIKSKWKPTFFYDTKILKNMLSFTLWTLLETISIWFSSWVDILIIGSIFSLHYLGLYKTSLNIVNALITVVTAAITPVMFSALSRFQNEEISFRNAFLRVQGVVAYLLFPMGLGLFIYRDVATQIMLGEQWAEASFIIGVWGVTSVIKVVLSDFNSECFRAKGKPKLSFLLQMIHLAFLIPTCIFSLKFGFETFVYVRAFIRFQLMITSLVAMQIILNIAVKSMFNQVLKPIIFTIVMGIVAYGLRQISDSIVWNVTTIIICIIIYGVMVLVYAKDNYEWILNKIPESVIKG